MNSFNLKFKLLIALIVLVGLRANAAEIWISTSGSDSNIGTKDLPLATLPQAVLKARQLRQANDPSIVGGIHIILKGGTYQLSQTLVLSQKDAGTAASPTYIEAAPGETPVISGAVTVDGWQDAGVVPGLPAVAQNRIWVANTPQVGGATLNFRQLWAKNGKRNRASTLDAPLTRLISVDKAAQNFIIPTPKMPVKNAKNMELTVVQDWALASLRVNTIDSLGLKTKLTFKQPESGLECKRPWPRLSGVEGALNNQYFFLSNAIELLNKPYEWYNDSTAGKLYYWPRAGEDMSTFKAYAPALETLIRLEGTLDSTVSYIKFKGISFEHTTWMRPSYAGHIPLQSGQYILDAYLDASAPGGNVAWVGRQAGGVMLKGASHINFDGCIFKNMAATGLDFVSGTHNDSVQGCVFTDIGGNAIQVGYFGDKDFEAHKAYNPADNRLVCQNEVIKNNYIKSISTEDWGCIGVNVGFASDITIAHNEIADVNYAAISVGWGWTNLANCMKNNKINANYIHGFANNMQDVGGIYTLSSQPNSQMIGNRIEGQGTPLYNANSWAFCIYLDEGTDFYNVSDNWTPTNSLNKNIVGSSNTFGTNGPSVSSTVKSAAGLESAYQGLLLKVPATTPIPADSIYEYVQCYTPLYKTGNLVTDPECTTIATYKNWGNTAIISGANAYCGTSVQTTGKCGGSIDYSLTGKLLPNTIYRLRAMAYTNGNAGFTLNGCGINGSTANYPYSFNTGSSWQMIDFRFTTGNLASTQNFWFNSCGGSATDLRLDNFEIYPDTLPVLSASTSSISFKGTTSASFTVSGTNLKEAIALVAPAGITLSTYSIPANPTATSVTVTYDGITTLNDTIRLTSSGVTVKIAVQSSSRNPNLYIYICFGQSNMEGQGAIEAQDKTVDSRFKVLQSLDCTSTSRTKGNWYPALPPLCLCDKGLTPADYFGRTMVQYLPDSVTIGVINVSVGGCDIRLFDKDLYQNYVAVPNQAWFTDKIKVYNGNPRKHLMDLARLAQQDGVIKGMLMHQGEANLGDMNWPLYVKKVYNDMLNELSLGADTVPLLSGEVLYTGDFKDMNTIVRQLPNTIPTAHIISAAGCGAMDFAHFNSEGYRIIGKRYAAKMLSLMGISVDETALGIALKDTINPGTINLTHQWTFDDGTANDVVGTANGTLKGGATIADGVLKTDAAGQYLELPANQLGLTTYPALSFETWFKSKSKANTGSTMLCYMGDTYSGKGANGFFLSPARTDNTSRVSISCGNTTSPWSAESYAGSAEFDDGLLHQAVGVISSTNITFYVDGIKQTTSALAANNSLANIKLNYAYLAKSGYTADPTWLGSVDKFSLYNKALSDEEVLYLYQGGSHVTTSLSSPSQNNIKVYPSVVADYICFRSPENIQDGFFKLISMTGQQVYSRRVVNMQQGQFDISAIPSGMYVAQIAGNQLNTSFLIVKK